MSNKLHALIGFFFGAFGAILGTSCSSSAVPSEPDVALVAGDPKPVAALLARARPAGLEGQVVAAINDFRRERGRRPLVRHQGLDELAARHSAEMGTASRMSHAGFDDRARRAEEEHGLVWAAENVLRSYGHADSGLAHRMVQAWIESSGHRRNLLRDNTHIGVGLFRGEGGAVWATQLSARPY